jgi:3-methyladenine DNA glycosylase AlkD
LNSKVHEHRLTALLILVSKYQKSDDIEKKKIFDFYLRNIVNVNNWDLVDLSAPKIVGDYLLGKDKSLLYWLAKSDSLWERRIAILSTFKFIASGDFVDAIRISELLLHDPHDLIHKAVGWALREIGKKDESAEERFLKRNYLAMPRTMLRYAIERFSENKRRSFLNK